jgi:hypothetical protein
MLETSHPSQAYPSVTPTQPKTDGHVTQSQFLFEVSLQKDIVSQL